MYKSVGSLCVTNFILPEKPACKAQIFFLLCREIAQKKGERCKLERQKFCVKVTVRVLVPF